MAAIEPFDLIVTTSVTQNQVPTARAHADIFDFGGSTGLTGAFERALCSSLGSRAAGASSPPDADFPPLPITPPVLLACAITVELEVQTPNVAKSATAKTMRMQRLPKPGFD